ncbi:Carbohydrate (N-acetylgalactosamine 4-0) sulfotransferase 14 [Seminavis robusta]|uniref:Carbohydrate (N-acetylgalactosamine 4-0) sulfotransferase 14 n=1 Tax=Seminavis robusta TaxID=568900 RepID=A0A9N8HGK9_9STRA|nr:Carbohydrate (N-acetylgalactosamine 4-0) sulfotransferase 14 [Seminavis robusta]|eukprot:Sro489_g153390.1 Carbohydrate (N-acetylgalactosamine 4-0) sulfotransferase 14 (353) ;mRNA; r:55786-56844
MMNGDQVSEQQRKQDKQKRIQEALKAQTKYPSHYLFAHNDKHKLMFCWIEKVGCTFFKKIFSNLHSEGITERILRQNLRDVMQNMKWEKAVFYREPLSRFLSGWLDKCRGRTRVYCESVFGGSNVTFPEAVFLLKDMDPEKVDGHFHPQVQHCGGVTRDVLDDVFTTKKRLQDHDSTRYAVRKMLQPFELTDEQFDRVYPPGLGNNDHSKNANAQLKEHYQDPQLVSIIVQYFIKDYKVFQIPVPDFARDALYQLRERKDPYAFNDEEMLQLGLPLGPPPPTALPVHAVAATNETAVDLALVGAVLGNSQLEAGGVHAVFVIMVLLWPILRRWSRVGCIIGYVAANVVIATL